MTTKSEILKMSAEELQTEKWSDRLDKQEEKDKNSDCSNCLYCRNLKNERAGYWICNIQVTKEEFEAKKKELGIK